MSPKSLESRKPAPWRQCDECKLNSGLNGILACIQFRSVFKSSLLVYFLH